MKKLGLPLRYYERNYVKHISAEKLIEDIGRKRYRSYFTFAFVRNPWDWQVSLYKYMLKAKEHHQHALVKRFSSFSEYIRWRCTEDVDFQRDLIYSKNGELLVDFVGRFENLQSDFSAICRKIGVVTKLEKLNVSNTKPYRQYYDKESRELVRKTFQPDIQTFNYDF